MQDPCELKPMITWDLQNIMARDSQLICDFMKEIVYGPNSDHDQISHTCRCPSIM